MSKPQWQIDIEERHLSPEKCNGKTFYEGHPLVDLQHALTALNKMREALDESFKRWEYANKKIAECPLPTGVVDKMNIRFEEAKKVAQTFSDFDPTIQEVNHG